MRNQDKFCFASPFYFLSSWYKNRLFRDTGHSLPSHLGNAFLTAAAFRASSYARFATRPLIILGVYTAIEVSSFVRHDFKYHTERLAEPRYLASVV